MFSADLAGNDMGVAVVIDDEAMVLHGLTLVLEQMGWRVLPAASEEEALLQVDRSGARPDVIVADYRLRNGRTGVEAIHALHARAGHSIPAVLLTGETSPDRLREARASGFVVLHKPVTLRELAAMLPATSMAPA